MKLFYLLVLVLISSCTYPKQHVEHSQKTPASMDAVAYDILSKIKEECGEDKKIGVFPFEDKNLGLTEGNKKLFNKILDKARTSDEFNKLSVGRVSQDDLGKVDYTVSGESQYEGDGGFFQVKVEVIDNHTYHRRLLLNYRTEKLSQEQISLDKYNPLGTDPSIALIPSPKDEDERLKNKERLELKTIISDGKQKYDDKNYEQSLQLFRQAVKNKEGSDNLNAYAGIYNSCLRLGLRDDAEKAFGKMVTIAAQKGKISVKFLFKKNSANDLDMNADEEQMIWLNQLTEYFKNNSSCVMIIGHSSYTGSFEYNMTLSKKRANTIQELLHLKGRSQTVGKGFTEAKGVKGDENVFDRRVEFKLTDCTTLTLPS